MTENDALKIASHCLGVQAEQEVCEECPVYGESGIVCKEIARTAISALEEIQHYREIGNVEECREAKYKIKPEKPKKAKNKYSKAYACPCCGYILIHKDETGWFCGKRHNYCPECGKKIDWSEEGDIDGK